MRGRRFSLIAVLLALAFVAGCRREAEKPAAFQAPADGRLTEAQVRTYLKDGEAGFGRQEAGWVRDRMREARLAGLASGLDRKVIEGRRRILRSLEERRRAATDPARIAELDRDIAEVRRLLEGAPPEPSPAVRDNAGLVARFENKETP
jgi:hypothetical protein